MQLTKLAAAIIKADGYPPAQIVVPYEIRSVRRGAAVYTGLCFSVAPRDVKLRINLGNLARRK